MVNFKMVCPNCGAVIKTASPDAVIWEFCPGCRHHIWDMYDAMMADVCETEQHGACGRGAHANN